MFSLEYRKQLTKKITQIIENFLYKYTKNKTISGYILVLIHWLVMLLVYLYIFLGKINTIFYLCCIFLLFTYILHLYFSGCILIRVERELLNTNKWWGIWTMLFIILQYMDITITKSLTSNVYLYWTIYVIIVITIRLIYKKKLP